MYLFNNKIANITPCGGNFHQKPNFKYFYFLLKSNNVLKPHFSYNGKKGTTNLFSSRFQQDLATV